MKKLRVIISIMAILLGGILLASCGGTDSTTGFSRFKSNDNITVVTTK